MQYHLMASAEATPANWRRMLRAFAAGPHYCNEEAIKYIRKASRSAKIRHNRSDEMLTFLNPCWEMNDHEFARLTFEATALCNFRLVREQRGMKVVLRYPDNALTGTIQLIVSSQDPERVRQFADSAAWDVGEIWSGSLRYEDNGVFAPEDAIQVSIDHAMHILMEWAPVKSVTV